VSLGVVQSEKTPSSRGLRVFMGCLVIVSLVSGSLASHDLGVTWVELV
jgi:hypothetical protein